MVYRQDGTSEAYRDNVLISRKISEEEIIYNRKEDGSISTIKIGDNYLHDYQNIDLDKTSIDQGIINFNTSDGRKIFGVRSEDGYLEFGEDAGYYTKIDRKGPINYIWIYDSNDNPILATDINGGVMYGPPLNSIDN